MAKMKNSGVEWIGEIPDDWECKKLKYIANSFAKGSGITKEDIVQNGDISCVRYGEIYTKYNIKFDRCETKTNLKLNSTPQYFSHGDLLFTCTGELVEEIGKSIVYLGYENCLAGGDIVVMKHSQNPKFMGYAVSSWYAQEQKSRGKTKLKVVHTSASALGNIYILLPPKDEQESIANFLDEKTTKIDSLIANEEKQIEKLKSYKQSLITETVTKGLDKNAKMKDSGVEWIGEIPEGWNRVPLKTEFTFSKGLAITKADLVSEGLPVISYGQIHSKQNSGTYVKNSLLRFVPEKYSEDNESSLGQQGDIFFADTSEDYEGIGDFVLIDTSKDIYAGYHTILARPNRKFNAKYFSYLFLSDIWRSQLRSKACGIKVYSVTQTMLKKIDVIIPSETEQNKIVNFLDQKCKSIESLIILKESKIEKLNAYKKSLIYEYVTGKKEA